MLIAHVRSALPSSSKPAVSQVHVGQEVLPAHVYCNGLKCLAGVGSCCGYLVMISTNSGNSVMGVLVLALRRLLDQCFFYTSVKCTFSADP